MLDLDSPYWDDELEALAEQRAEAMAADSPYMAGRLVLDLNRATTTADLRRVWRQTRDLDEPEQSTVRTFAVVKDEMLKESA